MNIEIDGEVKETSKREVQVGFTERINKNIPKYNYIIYISFVPLDLTTPELNPAWDYEQVAFVGNWQADDFNVLKDAVDERVKIARPKDIPSYNDPSVCLYSDKFPLMNEGNQNIYEVQHQIYYSEDGTVHKEYLVVVIVEIQKIEVKCTGKPRFRRPTFIPRICDYDQGRDLLECIKTNT